MFEEMIKVKKQKSRGRGDRITGLYQFLTFLIIKTANLIVWNGYVSNSDSDSIPSRFLLSWQALGITSALIYPTLYLLHAPLCSDSFKGCLSASALNFFRASVSMTGGLAEIISRSNAHR